MKYILLIISISLVNTCKTQESDSTQIIKHLTEITKTDGYRNYINVDILNKTADYILSEFNQFADTAYFQAYIAERNVYKNVICRFGDSNKPLIVIGAHYDVCGNQEGADDNASGVVALLELARMLKGKDLDYSIELVAYSLEEPPFFRTKYMGSYIHAKSLKDTGRNVYGMIAIEMIGYYSDEDDSQDYPIKVQKIKYGEIGDYILIAKRSGHGKFVKYFSKGFKNISVVDAKTKTAPAQIPGIDFSDHLNYWEFGYDALMITNTAFYRNPNYHKSSDTMNTLDIKRMSEVINAIYFSLINLSN